MKKFCLMVLLLAAPAWGQGQPTPLVKPAAKGTPRVDNCAPIGRTANGELVYSMKCDNIPAPISPPQARLEETAPPPPPPAPRDEGRTGLFGWSYDKRQPE
jgi:hypothetical protein